MSKPLCTKKHPGTCFAQCGINNDRCSILMDMTSGRGCSFYKTPKQYIEDAKKYPSRPGMVTY